MTGTSPSATRARLSQLLAECVRQAEGLRSALEIERAALEANDATALDRATESKAGPVSRLAALESERAAASRAAGFEPGPAGMDAVIGWCDEGSLLADDWRRLLDLARECDRQNTTNGAIIRLRRQQVMAGLTILRGGEVSGETYAATGVETSASGGRALARA